MRINIACSLCREIITDEENMECVPWCDMTLCFHKKHPRCLDKWEERQMSLARLVN